MVDSQPILVADDNAVDRMILTKIIRDQGYQVIEAEDGVAALQQYRAHQPQIVLLDALMPKMDGFEVAQSIKAESSERFTPVIFLTALTEAEELARCLEAGGDDFLSKPYNRVILKAKLEALRRVRELHQTTQLQRDAITRNNQRLIQEQEAAKAIFDRIAHREYLETDFIHYLMSPIALFNGDVLLAAPTPRGTFNLLLGDFTGHGLTASVGAMPLADSFYTLTQRGLGLKDIVGECNRKLQSVLPGGYFCCALLAEVNFDKGTIEYWSGGLPAGYLLGMEQGDIAIREMPSRHLPLGILSADKFNTETEFMSVMPGERLVLCTDGVIEAVDPQDSQFGEERLLDVLQNALSAGESTITKLQDALALHTGSADGTDDITALQLTIIPAAEFNLQPKQPALEYEVSPKQWRMSYEVRDESLVDFTPFPLLQRILLGTPALRTRMSDIGMVITELYSNALEHGVLGLDSALKRDADGFAHYYRTRATALQDVRGFVRFDLTCQEEQDVVKLEIMATDSGDGFFPSARCLLQEGENSIAETTNSDSTSLFHGRGIRLLSEICQSVTHLNNGSTAKVELVCERDG